MHKKIGTTTGLLPVVSDRLLKGMRVVLAHTITCIAAVPTAICHKKCDLVTKKRGTFLPICSEALAYLNHNRKAHVAQ